MKFCAKCGAQCEDSVNNCPSCGTAFSNPSPAAPVIYVDPKDHTGEFDAADIAENKIFAMLCYLFGLIGIIIAGIFAKDSAYVRFHTKWASRIIIISTLCAFMAIIPIVGWVAAAVCEIICVVLLYIAFFQVCGNKAKEPAIISNFSFLK